ncbi:TPA: ErmCL family antibiotic resistance leader peptide, partial [Streptococcus agalactiae]|nr:ErmCL family antibiotic resistance leader peptide [Streptococcus agalactiae]
IFVIERFHYQLNQK